MKIIRFPFSAYIICTLLFCSGVAQGQSVTINSVSGTKFCAGDSISVTFTATGFWGHRNAFTLQLSDPTGSFSNGFQNIASLVDTLPGTFTIKMSTLGVASSTHYRVRILAAIPYTISADNGSDIAIWARLGSINLSSGLPSGSTGMPITFTAIYFITSNVNGDLQDNAFWDFGSGATPATATTIGYELSTPGFSHDATYSTPGDKTVTVRIVNPGGCSETISYKLHIYDCSAPPIPHDAIVINSSATGAESKKAYWVNPGFTLFLDPSTQQDTIFAEPGSTISGGYNSIIYMKQGSVLNHTHGSGSNTVIFGDGASINPGSGDLTLNCPTLDFDYNNAPPNAAHPLDGAVNTSLPSLTISPNPTRGVISIHGAPSNDINISVLNLLGETVMELKNLPAPNFNLDLSKLIPGIYYIRFSSAHSVVTKKIIKN